MQKELDNNYGRRATGKLLQLSQVRTQLKSRALPSCRFLDTNLLHDGFEGAQKRARASVNPSDQLVRRCKSRLQAS